MFKISFDAGKAISFNLTEEQVNKLIDNPAVHQHLLTIGLKNVVGDSHASIKRDDFESEEEWRKASEEKASLKLGALMAGDLRAQSGTRQPKLDDFAKFARAWLLAKLKAAYIAKNGKEAWKAKTEGDTGAEFITALINKNAERFADEVMAAYKAELEKRAKEAALAEDMDLDL